LFVTLFFSASALGFGPTLLAYLRPPFWKINISIDSELRLISKDLRFIAFDKSKSKQEITLSIDKFQLIKQNRTCFY